MPSSRISTTLDEELLSVSGAVPAPPHTPPAALPRRSGADVSKELGGRLLLRYVVPAQLGAYRTGDRGEHFVTPTAYDPDEAVKWLALPAPTVPREFALVIDPNTITLILGPRTVHWGGGIEYILPDGFPKSALHFPWEVVVA